MVERTIHADPLDWRVLAGMVVSEILGLIALLFFDGDGQFFLFLFLLGPALLFTSVIVIVLLFRAAIRNRRQLPSLMATLAILWVISSALVSYERSHPGEVRDTARWLIWAHSYKQAVLSQPSPPAGDLKHIEWNATGFAGIANNTDYLVMDPVDALSAVAERHQSGKVAGIPCEVRDVRRMESYWYVVFFYTDDIWDGARCESLLPSE